MKIAMIGLGHVAEFQIEALEHISEITLVAAHDINPDRAVILPSGVQFYSKLDDLLEKSKADLILASTPNVTHYEIGKQVLERGCSLLLEKPCCQTETEMTELVNTAQRKRVFFDVALHAAYARDVKWYLSQVIDRQLDYGPVSGFYCGFFDPYYDQQKGLTQFAHSLGGAWFDSGINALSVIAQFVSPSNLMVIEGRMTRVPLVPCSELQGSATFHFLQDNVWGHGLVDTNWTLGLNRKVTHLFYCYSDVHVVLHHSNESVYVYQKGQLLFKRSLQNEFTRLTNHYFNLFRDLLQRFKENRSNINYAVQIHRLFFSAYESQESMPT